MANSCVRVIGIVTLILVFVFGSLTSFAVWSPHWRTTVNGSLNGGVGVMTVGTWGNAMEMSYCINTDQSLKERVCWTTLGECWCIVDDGLMKLEFASLFARTPGCGFTQALQMGQDMVNQLWQSRIALCASGGIMFLSLYVSCCVIGCANVGSSIVMVVFTVLALIAFAVGFAPAHKLYISQGFTCNGASQMMNGPGGAFTELGYAYYCAIGALLILIVIIILNIIGAKIASDHDGLEREGLHAPINVTQQYATPYTYGQPQYQVGSPVMYTPQYNVPSYNAPAYNTGYPTYQQSPVTYKQPA